MTESPSASIESWPSLEDQPTTRSEQLLELADHVDFGTQQLWPGLLSPATGVHPQPVGPGTSTPASLSWFLEMAKKVGVRVLYGAVVPPPGVVVDPG